MPHTQKLLKKNNQTDDCNKSVHEKWMGECEYFWSPEGQEEYNCINEELKARVKKHREENGADIDEPILDVRSPYQMDPNSLVARAYRSHLCVQPWSQTKEQEEGRKMGGEETKTDRDANWAVARGNQHFFNHNHRLRSRRMSGR